MHLRASDANGLVYKAVRACRIHGHARSPRGQATLDLGPTSLELNQPSYCVASDINRRGLSPAIGCAEALFLVAGTTDAELLTCLSPFFGKLLTADGEVDGAYGPRVRDHLERVVEQLHADPTTRQATAVVWDSSDPRPSSRDVPCTVSFTFYNEHAGELGLSVHMRSSDVWMGLPYDLMMFTTLQSSVANALDAEVGHLWISTTSLHLYERNLDDASDLQLPPLTSTSPRLTGVGRRGMGWAEIRDRAARLIEGLMLGDETVTETYLRQTLHNRLAEVASQKRGSANFVSPS